MFSYKDSNHQVVGPVSADEIRKLVADGVISRNSLMSAETSDFWQPAYRFDELTEIFDEAQKQNEAIILGEESESEATERKPPTPSEAPIDIESSVEPETETPPEDEKPEPDKSASEKEPKDEQPVNYRFVGGDGREYGPVTLEQLKDWIRQRRADRDSRVRRDGSENWTTLGQLVEFQEVFDEQSRRQQSSPPPLDSALADQIAEDVIGDGYNLDILSCFRRSWQLYQNNFGILTGTTALVILILSALNSFAGAGNVVGFALEGVFLAGLSLVYLKRIRGQVATVQDTFEGFSKGFIPLLISSILTSIFIFIGFALCILPGVYLLVAWLFVFPLIFEFRLDFWPAMELSRKVVHERWWEMFAITCGVGVLAFVGVLLFGIGIFFTAPIAIGAIMYAYEDIFSRYSPARSRPPVNEDSKPADSSSV